METKQIQLAPKLTEKKPSELLLQCDFKQVSGEFKTQGDNPSYCASGALFEMMWDGPAFNNQYGYISVVPVYFDAMQDILGGKQSINCPECDGHYSDVLNIIPHLNNNGDRDHGWSFKQIGEWLETKGY